jgi:environmental stress-induced protein Ves
MCWRDACRTLAIEEFLILSARILRSGDYQKMPWKNGGGTTTEIFKSTGADGQVHWRLSIADVAGDGPFSEFPDIDRWIMMVEGKGMELTISGLGTKRIEKPFEPLAFSGDAKTDCKLLDGPIRDFNLMVARNHAQGNLQVVTLSAGETRTFERDVAALHVLDGCVERAGEVLAVGDTLIAEGAAIATVSAPRPTRLAVITLQTKRT